MEGPGEGSPPAKLRRERPPERLRGEEAPSGIAEAVRSLQRADGGCLASLGEGAERAPERLSLQTGRMRSLFLRFPESLLLHRLRSPDPGRPLYAFLVESREREARLVHFALLRDEAPEQLLQMLRAFQEFNPEWRRVRVVFVDASFPHRALLRSAFPDAQVLLSLYHAVRLLERRLRQCGASSSSKETLRAALRRAVFSPSAASLERLSRQVRGLGLLSPELQEHLHRHWFSCEMLWYAHAKKGLHACSTYFDSLDLLTQNLDGLFGSRPSLEAGVLAFLEHADCFNTERGLERLSQSFSRTEDPLCRSPEEERRSRPQPASRHGSRQPPTKTASKGPVRHARRTPSEPLATMLSALRDTCTDLAYRLCLTEWDAVQASTQLVNSSSGKTTVQVLEEEYEVSKDGLACNCSFHRCYQLPCRHVLATLLETRQVLNESVVGRRWQKKYQHLLVLAGQDPPAVHSMETPGAEVVAAAPEERRDKIQSLSKELGNLLLQSEGKELEERISTLQMIVSIWNKGCELQQETKEETDMESADREDR